MDYQVFNQDPQLEPVPEYLKQLFQGEAGKHGPSFQMQGMSKNAVGSGMQQRGDQTQAAQQQQAQQQQQQQSSQTKERQLKLQLPSKQNVPMGMPQQVQLQQHSPSLSMQQQHYQHFIYQQPPLSSPQLQKISPNKRGSGGIFEFPGGSPGIRNGAQDPLNPTYSYHTIEAIAQSLRQSGNYCENCPFCNAIIDLFSENLSMIISLKSPFSEKLYLSHLECFQHSSHSSPQVDFPKLVTPRNLPKMNVSLNTSIPTINLNSYSLPSSINSMCSISWEFFHPVSSLIFIRLEKLMPALQNNIEPSQVLHWNMINTNPTMFEPNLIILPNLEFRTTLRVYNPLQQEPLTMDFFLDLSFVQKDPSKIIQFTYSDNGGNGLIVIGQLVEYNEELLSKVNYKSNFFTKPPKSPYLDQSIPNPKRYVILLRNMLLTMCQRPGIEGGSTPVNYLQSITSPPKVALNGGSMAFSVPLTSPGKSVIKKPDDHINMPINSNNHLLHNRMAQQFKHDPRKPSKPDEKMATFFEDLNSAGSLKSGGGKKPSLNKDRGLTRSHTCEEDYNEYPGFQDVQEEGRTPTDEYNYEEDFGALDINEDSIDINAVKGKISVLAKTNQGSRVLQKILGKVQVNELNIFIQEIETEIADLMLDSYGNYMIQSLVNVCTVEQRYLILEQIMRKIPEISCNKKGTHSLQTFVSLISMEKEINLMINAIKNDILRLSKDSNATHFIQKMIVCFDEKYLKFLYENIVENFVEYGNNPFGLCVLKSIMNKFKANKEKSEKIIDQLYQNHEVFIQNPFGNYAIQTAFEYYGYERCERIINKILSKIIQFSSQKFSSNVVEKLVSNHGNKFLDPLIKELIDKNHLPDFMKNKYGSFILAKVLSLVDPQTYNYLVDAVRKNLVHVHTANFKSKWQSFLDRFPDSVCYSPLTNKTASQYFNIK